MKNHQVISVIAAHPDDEILGCGGTAARLANEGHSVYFSIFGEGITSRYKNREDAEQTLLTNLNQNAQKAAEIIGVKDVFFYPFPDNRFDTIPLLDIIKEVEELNHKLKPDIIFTHHPGDLNIDHVNLHRAVMTSIRPVHGYTIKEIYTFEIASSSDWAMNQFGNPFLPNTFFDISSTLDTKINAMEAYHSERRVTPHPRAPESLRAIAQSWGRYAGCQFSEAFQLVRSIR